MTSNPRSPQPDLDAAPFVAALDEAGFRDTVPRRTVAQLVAAREGRFSAIDLLDAARAQGTDISRSTVFRALDRFIELGLIERIDLPDGHHAYVRCAKVDHHHHIACTACRGTTSVPDSGLAIAVEEIRQRTGWLIESHRLELFGLCPRC